MRNKFTLMEFAIFRSFEAHLKALLGRADKNKSGDVDLNEAKVHVNELIFPGQKAVEAK